MTNSILEREPDDENHWWIQEEQGEFYGFFSCTFSMKHQDRSEEPRKQNHIFSTVNPGDQRPTTSAAQRSATTAGSRGIAAPEAPPPRLTSGVLPPSSGESGAGAGGSSAPTCMCNLIPPKQWEGKAQIKYFWPVVVMVISVLPPLPIWIALAVLQL